MYLITLPISYVEWIAANNPNKNTSAPIRQATSLMNI